MIAPRTVQRRHASWMRPAPAGPFISRFVYFILVGGIVLAAITWASKARAMDANGNPTVIGGRPAGCPRAYCGCGLRKFLGIDDKSLDLAWNWARKFRRTHAGPGAVAVRAHHVMLIVSHISGSTYLVRDYNGGRHLSYLHQRNVRGYVFVDPTSRVAAR